MVHFLTYFYYNFYFILSSTEDAVFAEPGPGGCSMMAGAVYTLPPQRNVPLPVAMQRLIPMATQGGKPRSFTLPRDSNLHTLLMPPAKEEQQTHNGELSQVHICSANKITLQLSRERNGNSFIKIIYIHKMKKLGDYWEAT